MIKEVMGVLVFLTAISAAMFTCVLVNSVYNCGVHGEQTGLETVHRGLDQCYVKMDGEWEILGQYRKVK